MFDPYYKWLGILPKDQPPNHYRLLGVEIFEGDLDVIEGAADRQMGFVRQYQSGEHATHAAKILNELAIARLCLLKSATKTAYDAKLRQALAPPEPEFPELPFSTGEPVNERAPKKGTKKAAKSKASGVPQPLMIGGGIAVIVVVILAVFLSSGGPKPGVEKLSKSGSVAETSPTRTGADAVKSTSVTPNDRSASNVMHWSDSKLVTEAVGDPIDLLKLVDPKRDFVSGEWQQTATALIGAARSALYVPVKLPEDYQLKFAIRRLEGADTLTIGFMMAGRQGMLAIDGWDATCSGLYADGREGRDNCTTRQGSLFKGQSVGKIELTVHPGHLHATFDGQTIVDWHGNPERLFLHSAHGLASRESPFLLTSKAKYVFESASLIPIKPQPALSRPARLDRDVDVVPLVDLDRDVQRGIWSVNKGALYSPEGWGKIYLPTVVPEEYTLSGTIELPADNRGNPALAIGLPSGGSHCQITLKNDECMGIDMVDGLRWSLNETRFSGPCLKPGVPAKFACTVTKGGIRMEVDGRTLIDWRGEPWHLSVPGDWVPADERRLYVGALSHFKFRDIKLSAPVPPPKSPTHDPITAGKPLDLLSLIDPAREARAGTWTKEGNVLRTLADVDLTKLIVPVDVPDEYKLTMRIAREPGETVGNDALNLLLPVGIAKADIVIDGTRSQFTGIRIGGKDWNENATLYKGAVIPQGPAVELVLEVKATGINLTSQGRQIVDWIGNPENFTCQHDRRMPGQRIGIAAWQSKFRIEKLNIQALPPSSFPAVKPLGSDGKLLPILEVQRDTRNGNWKLEGDRLTCPMLSGCRLRIPVAVPPRYVFSAMVERNQGNGDLFIGLPVGGHSTSITIDAQNGTQAGIDLLDGHRYNHNLVNRRYKERLLPQNRSVAVRCVVLPDTIVVTCGDKELIRWHGDPRRLSALAEFIPPNYSTADRTHLWLGAWDSQFVFRDLALKPLTDAEAEELSKSFSGVFPATSQTDVPLAVSADPAESTVSTNPVGPTNPSFSPSVSKPSEPAKPGEWIDLLEWSEGVDWAPRGINWNENIEGKPTRTGIRMKNANGGRFPLPAIIDGDYEMEVEFTRHEGRSDAAVYFPVGIHTMRMLLSAGEGAVSQVDYLDGKVLGEHRPGTYTNNEPHRVFIRVRNGGEKAAFNIDFDKNKDYFQWEGASPALTNFDWGMWKTTMLRHPWIGSHVNNLVFHKVRIRMLSGTIRRDVITDLDRQQDLKDGFVRLVGQKANAIKVGWGKFVINQIPLEGGGGYTEHRWPTITADFKFCDDFYGAHAPSRLKCPIPTGVRSFSVVGYNDGERTAKFQVFIDGKQVRDSGETGIAILKVDLPAKSSLLELVTDPGADAVFDHTYWCYPRFHAVPTERVTDKMLDGKSAAFKFSVASGTAEHGVTRNKPIGTLKSVPIHFRDAQPCDEFLFPHASSTLTYQVPEGMTRFTAIGYNVLSQHVKFEVWADAKRIFESPEAGIIPIDLKLPPRTKTIELKIDDLGNNGSDFSMWCYPRLHRK